MAKQCIQRKLVFFMQKRKISISGGERERRGGREHNGFGEVKKNKNKKEEPNAD